MYVAGSHERDTATLAELRRVEIRAMDVLIPEVRPLDRIKEIRPLLELLPPQTETRIERMCRHDEMFRASDFRKLFKARDPFDLGAAIDDQDVGTIVERGFNAGKHDHARTLGGSRYVICNVEVRVMVRKRYCVIAMSSSELDRRFDVER